MNSIKSAIFEASSSLCPFRALGLDPRANVSSADVTREYNKRLKTNASGGFLGIDSATLEQRLKEAQ